MIKRKSSYPIQHNEKMRGGDGIAVIENLLTPSELYDKGRLFAKITLEPGASIGNHVHKGEMEAFYIISGVAQYNDNGEMVTLTSGDTSLTQSGMEHSVKSVGDTPLEIIALILFK